MNDPPCSRVTGSSDDGKSVVVCGLMRPCPYHDPSTADAELVIEFKVFVRTGARPDRVAKAERAFRSVVRSYYGDTAHVQVGAIREPKQS